MDLCEYLSAENNPVLFDDYGILPVIDHAAAWWRDGEGTRLVDPQRADNIVYDHRGDVLCICPTTGEMRSMAYWGYEKKRRCIKYRCPATLQRRGVSCKGAKSAKAATANMAGSCVCRWS